LLSSIKVQSAESRKERERGASKFDRSPRGLEQKFLRSPSLAM